MLKVDKISFGYKTKEVLRGISLTVNYGDRIGLIGPNGSGKSTLLRIISGEIKPSKGLVISEGLFVGYMQQDPTEFLELNVSDYLKKLTGVFDAEREFEIASNEAIKQPNSLLSLEEAITKMEHLGAYDFDQRLSKIAKKTGLSEILFDRVVKSLSGGQRKRVLLSAVLLSKFDILLLDEPTNDLDLAGISLLEKYIRSSKSAFVIVTHDRRMLRDLANKIVELYSEGDKIELHSLGYEEYLKARERQQRSIEETYEKFQDEKKRLEEISRRLSAESRRAEAGKNTSDNEKLAFNSTREKAATSFASSARSVSVRLEKLIEPPKPLKEIDLRFVFKGSKMQVSNRLVVMERGSLSYPGFTFGPLDLEINRGDRIVITGLNGSGKTTLLRILAKEQYLENGEIRFGRGVKYGLIDQNKTLPLPEKNVLENAKRLIVGRNEAFDESQIRRVLDHFSFDSEKLNLFGVNLSPGERARLLLVMLVARETNFLLMDEPTNHLDIPAIEELERALATYPETFIVVSHDREFIARIKPTRTLEVIAGRLK